MGHMGVVGPGCLLRPMRREGDLAQMNKAKHLPWKQPRHRFQLHRCGHAVSALLFPLFNFQK